MRNFYDKLLAALSLQNPANHPGPEQVESLVLEGYARMMDRYLADLPQIPEGSLLELRYEQLTSDPLGTLGRIYQAVDAPAGAFDQDRPRFEAYLGSVQKYRKNKYQPEPGLAEKVEHHWGRFIRRWGDVCPW
jgi:hypothetical protein